MEFAGRSRRRASSAAVRPASPAALRVSRIASVRRAPGEPERSSAEAIKNVAVEQGMRLLRDDGLEKVRLGVTSIAEVARVS